MRTASLVAALALALALVLVPTAPAAAGEDVVTLPHTYATPLQVTAPAGDGRLFVVERAGTIRVVDDRGAGTLRTFADLRSIVGTDGEGGLLGLAFSPDFDTDGRFWVSYTDTGGDSRVDRLRANSSRTAAVLASRVNVLQVDQPRSNHNGGAIAFASDGMLLVGLGDGGGSGDPFENGQDTSTLLGSILRLDVQDRAGSGYGVPPDNPFVGRAGRDEIWAYGLRNPYRFSVDPVTGDVWIGDVGQSTREEVDRLPYRPGTAFNLGWDRWEGTHCFESCGGTTGLTFPVHEYGHGDGRCSVTGGHVVRTPGAGALAGKYLFGDFCGGGIRVLDRSSGEVRRLRGGDVGRMFGFGVDGRGHGYVTTADRVHRIVDSGTRFADVGADDRFADDILALASADVTRGCSPPVNDLFCPRQYVTRAQMAAFIRRAAGYPLRDEHFRDVAATDRFAQDIGAIAAAGVTRGCNPPANDLFCPDRLVTRAQMAAFLARARHLPGQAESFRDVAATDTFARDIGAIAADRITRGCNPPANDLFCPDRFVTRQQMAAFLVRAFEL